MQLKYAHLADFATLGSNGKPIIVGIFDNIYAADVNAIALPLCFLVGAITARLTEGTDHQFEVRLVDADGHEVFKQQGQLKLGPTPRRTLEGIFMLGLFGIPLPQLGAYDFDVWVDDRQVGNVSFLVTEAPPK